MFQDLKAYFTVISAVSVVTQALIKHRMSTLVDISPLKVNPYDAEIFVVYTMKTKGFFHQKWISFLFLFHLNTYAMGLQPLKISTLSMRESTSDVRIDV